MTGVPAYESPYDKVAICVNCDETFSLDEPPYDGVAICDACRADLNRAKLKPRYLDKIWGSIKRCKWFGPLKSKSN
jgi:uncharacterized paraquat-inducible protein A